MKYLVLVAFGSLMTANAMASGFDTRRDYSDVCRGARLNSDATLLSCYGAENAAEVRNAKLGDELQQLPRSLAGKTQDAYSLDVLPDADTDQIYGYIRRLLGPNGIVIGYRLVDGYVNSEMGVKLQLTTTYNSKGAFVSGSVRDL
jgi:hypothetical protein